MANDRLILVCRRCDQGVTIWKHFTSGGYAPGESGSPALQGRMGRFIAAHLAAHDLEAASFLPEFAPFVVVTESTPHDFTFWNDPGDTDG
jgi:hypothetical protein